MDSDHPLGIALTGPHGGHNQRTNIMSTQAINRFRAINANPNRTKRAEAFLKNKRMSIGGSYVCDVTCGECNDTAAAAFGGWDAIACSQCGAEMYRHEAIPEIDSYYRLYAAGACDKWHAFAQIFAYIDSSRVTLKQAAKIGTEYWVPESATYEMRQRFNALDAAGKDAVTS